MATATMPAPTVAPAPTVTTCLGCDQPIPTGQVWCSWICRNLDDRHDDGRDDWEPEVDD